MSEILSALLFFFMLSFSRGQLSPIVDTPYGKIQGLYLDGAQVFYGIPFAQPPLGENRWRELTPAASWAPSVFQATTIPPACPQSCVLPPGMCANKTGEDCMYMTIHTPMTANPSSNLPVMAYIFGGRYIQGSGYNLLQDGRYLANHSNIVLVEFNYRIGALGFLVTNKGKDVAIGNYAIHDQRFALQWIQDNIASFGGNPNSVTIFGESSGGESVSIHLISKKSNHLFHKAIIQSHPFALPYRTHLDSVILGNKFAQILNCSNGDLQCMRSKSIDDILEAQDQTSSVIVNPLKLLELFQPWGPVVGGEDLPKQPVDAFASGECNHKPVMIGSTSDEGRLDLFEAYKTPVDKTQYYETIISDFRLHAFKILTKFPPIPAGDQREVLSIIGHQYIFFCPERKAARGISKYNGDTWMYVFNHSLSFDAWGANYSFCIGHPCHGSELPFVFHTASLGGFNFTEEEEVLSKSLMTYWTNFARTGDPSNSGQPITTGEMDEALVWPKYEESSDWQYLRFLTPNRVEKNYLDKECGFWDSLRYYP
ncbi:cAMP-regulated D2 protein-like [Glandiceps talaboti]